ncbi:lanthionine synthetase LanC family protein [Edaphobacter paludis]|uniref:Lanthionine synthetase LanC family protein n=1 Tax=Edaphobacter paludis TaxID=3035702 RepID=A0AAU7CU05_9BACT
MSITDPWVLPKGIIITPVEELAAKLREQVEANDGDFAISRPQSRTPSRILDSQSAALLREFATPKTIGQAVAYYSRAVGSDPEHTLEDALPMLTQLISWRLLVPPDSNDAEEIQPSFHAGETVAGCEVLQCFQALEDSEVYQVKRPTGQVAALKILRVGAPPESSRMFHREAAILRRLDGSVSPALLDEGVWEDRRYLLLEWCNGVDAGSAAAMLSQDRSADAQRKLFDLCCNILRAYSRLHDQGVTHSDIHPRNLLVDDANKVTIVDFGLAWEENVNQQFGEPYRGGVGFYFEPEYATAVRQGNQPPSASRLGEQYALAALLYSLLTGTNYIDFSLTRDEMMRQIAEDGPLPFDRRDMARWPEAERALGKALSKDPSARFISMSEFADAFSSAPMPEGGWIRSGTTVDAAALDRVLEHELARVGFSGGLINSGLPTAPKASLTYGAAGVAYALYRIACRHQDAALLSLADVWCRRALSEPENNDSFYNSEIEITPEIVGQIAPYHTLSGIHAVHALVSHAMCDVPSQAIALEGFMAASQKPCDNLDLALGRSGTLLVSSLLLDTLEEGDVLPRAPLMAFGNQTMKSVWQEIEQQPPIREGTVITYPGIAHGWAGILYAALCWHESSGSELPSGLEERLQQLMECAEPWGSGVRWPWVLPQGRKGGAASYMPGWCNGTAGHIFLWTAAHRRFRNDAYLRIAEKAAWNAWETPSSITNLCCGFAGQAYGLLNFYKHTGENIWLERARELASRAAAWNSENYMEFKLPPESLYKGEMGVALLAAELSAPHTACMPFFEPEGWPSPRRITKI